MKFHINQIVADARAQHGLQGYAELIETLRWGLTALGHEVGTGINAFASGCTNIAFGFQVLEPAQIELFPPGTVAYNLEQIAGKPLDRLGRYRAAAGRLHIWEYSAHNLAMWQQLQPAHPVIHVPVGWAPPLARIDSAHPQDIDVLFYGLPGDARIAAFRELAERGVSCVFACGLYGAARDSLIARARIVVNLGHSPDMLIFEIVRVSYLLANAKAVVAGRQPGTFVEADIADAVEFVPADCVASACRALLDNEAARSALERRGEELMRRRDIRPILERAIAATGLAQT